MIYDLIIIGMGISGISAAIYAKRSNLNVLIIDKSMPGGLLNNIALIDNYPGFSNISGPDLASNLNDQLESLDVETKFENVLNIKDGIIKEVITNKDAYQARSILISCGRSGRSLGLKNEKELMGHGLSTCALCDGPFFKGKTVAVVGSSSSAVSESLYLSKIVNKVIIINKKDKFIASEQKINELLNTPNIEVMYNKKITSLTSVNDTLSSIVLDDDEILNVSGLFIYIGLTPNADFVKDLGITDDKGYILVDEHQQTKIPGIYASGDITKKEIYQLVTAASEGASAAINIINYLG